MNPDLYDEFRAFEAKGLKREAKAAVKAFIASFEGPEDIEPWVWTYLTTIDSRQMTGIRFELFEALVFPVLKSGYERQESRSLLWLGKLIRQISDTKHLHRQIGFVSDEDLFRQCYAENPKNPDLRKAFRDCLICNLEFYFHEWPEILVDDTTKALNALQSDIDLAISLDDGEQCVVAIAEFQLMLALYRVRIGL